VRQPHDKAERTTAPDHRPPLFLKTACIHGGIHARGSWNSPTKSPKDGVNVEGGAIVEAYVRASNGVIHIIDTGAPRARMKLIAAGR
jgi:hypothetical protein